MGAPPATYPKGDQTNMSELTQETPLSDADHAVTYELRADLEIRTFGGSLALADGTLFDLAVALQDGDGQIVTDDERLITALDGHEALVRDGQNAAAPAAAAAAQIVAGAPDLTLEQAEAELLAENNRPSPRKTVLKALTARIEAGQADAASAPAESAELAIDAGDDA